VTAKVCAGREVQAPRTWGWTGHTIRKGIGVDPSPTHVGMDRSRRAATAAHHPKPHARGDGPVARRHPELTVFQAPRTWGWTGYYAVLAPAMTPSPTHVGMDQLHQHLASRGLPKPHARGDGPPVSGGLISPENQAPRTWGWTEFSTRPGLEPVPSPTHVGMDRHGGSGSQAREPKPHARGDGPCPSR